MVSNSAFRLNAGGRWLFHGGLAIETGCCRVRQGRPEATLRLDISRPSVDNELCVRQSRNQRNTTCYIAAQRGRHVMDYVFAPEPGTPIFPSNGDDGVRLCRGWGDVIDQARRSPRHRTEPRPTKGLRPMTNERTISAVWTFLEGSGNEMGN